MEENRLRGARFFPPKDLVYFLINTKSRSKTQTLFSMGNVFTARRLIFLAPKKTFFLS